MPHHALPLDHRFFETSVVLQSEHQPQQYTLDCLTYGLPPRARLDITRLRFPRAGSGVAGAGASVVFFLRPLCDDSTNEDRRNVYTHFLGAEAEVVALSLVVREPALSSAFVFLQVRVRQRAVNVHQRKKRFT